MSPIDVLAIIAMMIFAVYRQTRASEVAQAGRFKLAIIYAIVGVCVGGFKPPSSAVAVGLLVGSIALSVVVGAARAQLTKLWREPDGRVLMRGTTVTIALFIAMVAVKFALGVVESVEHLGAGEGFGEVMVLIAVMVGVQAELVWRRAVRRFGLGAFSAVPAGS